MTDGDRVTRPFDSTGLDELSLDEVRALEAVNSTILYERVANIALNDGNPGFILRPSLLMEFNRLVLSGLDRAGGQYRNVPVAVGGFSPAEFGAIPRLIEDLCERVTRSLATTEAVELASTVLWEINAIHPFVNGNGRTARAATTLVLLLATDNRAEHARLLELPRRIEANRREYYTALRASDAAKRTGVNDARPIVDFLRSLGLWTP